MPAPTTSTEFLGLVQKSGLIDPERLRTFEQQLPEVLPQPKRLAALAVAQALLTFFQAEQLLQGKWRGFMVGKYKILERLGSGGMGVVYLCEHQLMGRRVAVKVLPVTLASDPWFLERFYREAQAVAALNHPNIVRAHDIDQHGELHFLVMEYVDGTSLQDIVDKHGPMSIARAPQYIRQAALGLQHAHEVGIVHRDVKPGNLLLDRQGTIKILDMGLAHFFHEQQEALDDKNQQKAIVGTGDYLAPEQIVNSDEVDVRADIYGLGATFYFLLTGRPPFHEVSTDYHKLLWHLARQPKPVRDLRPEVPEPLAAVVMRMIAKNPWERYQVPADVVKALGAWTQMPIPPPPAAEMPRLSPAARQVGFVGKSRPLTPTSSAGGWSIVRTEGPARPSSSTVRPDSPATPAATPGAAETQRVGETDVKEVPPKAGSPTSQGANSSVTLATKGEENYQQDSTLLRECLAAENKNPTPPSTNKPAGS